MHLVPTGVQQANKGVEASAAVASTCAIPAMSGALQLHPMQTSSHCC